MKLSGLEIAAFNGGFFGSISPELTASQEIGNNWSIAMEIHSSRARCFSIYLARVAVIAILGMSVFSSGAKAGFMFVEGDQLSPPRESINFPSQVVLSVPWANQVNTTGGAVGNIQNPPPDGQLFFNGYDGTNSASNPLNLHSQNGNAFIEPVVSSSDFTHPDMFTITISASTLTQGGNPVALTGIDFQLDYNNMGNPGTVLFNVFDAAGNLVASSSLFDLKTSGQDHFVVTANGSDTISSIQIMTSTSAPLIDLKNIDITTGTPNIEPIIPEPASLTLSGIALAIGMGYGVRRRFGKMIS